MDEWYPNIDGVVVVLDNLIKNMNKYADITLVVPKMESNEDDSIQPFKIIRIDSLPVLLADYRIGLVDVEYFKLKKST